MTDRPIIFSGPMVRALLAGRKTQTRRLSSSPLRRVQPGDRLYVRESVSCGGVFSDVVEVRYAASAADGYTAMTEQIPIAAAINPTRLPMWPKWKPSIHAPRWTSRATLVVSAVRVERLRLISEADAKAEGLERGCVGGLLPTYRGTPDLEWRVYADGAYGDLWDSLHTTKGERWQDNPEVLVLTFNVVRGNIDRLPPPRPADAGEAMAQAAAAPREDLSPATFDAETRKDTAAGDRR